MPDTNFWRLVKLGNNRSSSCFFTLPRPLLLPCFVYFSFFLSFLAFSLYLSNPPLLSLFFIQSSLVIASYLCISLYSWLPYIPFYSRRFTFYTYLNRSYSFSIWPTLVIMIHIDTSTYLHRVVGYLYHLPHTLYLSISFSSSVSPSTCLYLYLIQS